MFGRNNYDNDNNNQSNDDNCNDNSSNERNKFQFHCTGRLIFCK